MRGIIGLGLVLGSIWLAPSAWAQNQPNESWEPGQGNPAVQRPAAYPDQPIVPRDPTLERRRAPAAGNSAPGAMTPSGNVSPGYNPPGVAVAQQPQAPFTLSPQEARQLDQILMFWEQSSLQVRNFQCQFTRLRYSETMGRREQNFLASKEEGAIQFEAPAKVSYQVEGNNPERWVCNGKSIFVYDYPAKRVLQYKLPPELQEKGITNGPLPFLFGARAAQLKQRYHMRIVPTPNDRPQSETWLEAFPKTFDDARNFSKANVILSSQPKTQLLLPTHLQIMDPNVGDRMVYVFEGLEVNRMRLLPMMDPFDARTPLGWKHELAQGMQGPETEQRSAAQPNGRPLSPR